MLWCVEPLRPALVRRVRRPCMLKLRVGHVQRSAGKVGVEAPSAALRVAQPRERRLKALRREAEQFSHRRLKRVERREEDPRARRCEQPDRRRIILEDGDLEAGRISDEEVELAVERGVDDGRRVTVVEDKVRIVGPPPIKLKVGRAVRSSGGLVQMEVDGRAAQAGKPLRLWPCGLDLTLQCLQREGRVPDLNQALGDDVEVAVGQLGDVERALHAHLALGDC